MHDWRLATDPWRHSSVLPSCYLPPLLVISLALIGRSLAAAFSSVVCTNSRCFSMASTDFSDNGPSEGAVVWLKQSSRSSADNIHSRYR
ncbi:hypothetical protein BDU57DRAFT_515835 [Ampelomyces quisqualis]|uniref:Uncharacterized protein n=1 Tax=Ampelomyces quisqualis TaxID=50730 RepID=A0A6A5QJV6_AMPQU|nr:hypothetical protein BDU57DRAFT_515835 [Ampelomyces quisqualis]